MTKRKLTGKERQWVDDTPLAVPLAAVQAHYNDLLALARARGETLAVHDAFTQAVHDAWIEQQEAQNERQYHHRLGKTG